MKKHILEAQLIEQDNAAKNDNLATTLTVEACKCKHLQKWLPHLLDLTCAILPKDNKDAKLEDEHKPTDWIMANPVHALHMSSQLEPDGATVFLPKNQEHGEPALYGEEQVRAKALVTNGISPAVELVNNGDNDNKSPHVTRIILPTHQPASTGATSTAATLKKQQQHPVPNVPSASMHQAPPMNMQMMQQQQPPPRRPSVPSRIVPPTSSSSSATTMPPSNHAQYLMPKPPPGSTMYPSNPNYMSNQPPPYASGGSAMQPPRIMPSMPPASATAGNPSLPPTSFHPPPSRVVAPPSTASTTKRPSTTTTTSTRSSTLTNPQYLLSNQRFDELQNRQHFLLQQVAAVSSSRRKPTSTTTSHKVKKRLKLENPAAVPLLPPTTLLTKSIYKVDNMAKWQDDARMARSTIEEWMERFRLSRIAYWQEQQHGQEFRQCQECCSNDCQAVGDELLQCLECDFVGCGPCLLSGDDSKQHAMHHMLLTGHTFSVTCGERADVFCFKCGDLIYHQIFHDERERIDISQRLPWMAWQHHAVQRSFDSMQFHSSPEYGVMWRGLIATYPQLVPSELVRAGRLSMKRLLVNRGEFASSPSSVLWGTRALGHAVYQNQKGGKDAWRIEAPVGMYNLGNTCFMTCILQCLIHCVPLQQHFLCNVGHHFKSCELVKSAYVQNDSQKPSGKSAKNDFSKANICLACEMDKLFLQYFGSSIGRDVTQAVCEGPCPLDRYDDSRDDDGSAMVQQGEPLVTTKLLAAAWKSGELHHLAGYEQGDAHEFLQAFLDTVSKHAGEYRKLIRFMQRMALPLHAKIEASGATSSQNVGKFRGAYPCCSLPNLSYLTFSDDTIDRRYYQTAV